MALGPPSQTSMMLELEKQLDAAICVNGSKRVEIHYPQFPSFEKEDWENILRPKYRAAGWIYAEYLDSSIPANRYFLFAMN